MLKKLKITGIIIMLILLVGQLIPSVVLAKSAISSDKINSSSTVSKVAESSSSTISKITESDLSTMNSSETPIKDSIDNSRSIQNSKNNYKLSTNESEIVLSNTGRITITATVPIKSSVYIQSNNDYFSLDLEKTKINNPNYIFKETRNRLEITPPNNNQNKQIRLVVKAIKVGSTDFQLIDNQTKSNKLRINAIQNKTPKVLANNPTEFDDGITNWVSITKTSQAEYPITDNVSLAFTFGKFGGNTAIPTDSLNPDPAELMPNIYLVDNSSGTTNYISAFYEHSGSSPHSSNNYGIVTNKTQNPLTHNGYDDSGKISLNEVNKGAGIEYTTFQNDNTSTGSLFEGSDSQGRKVLKKVVFSPKYKYKYEILYRFNLDTPIIQQEMYFKNTDTKDLEYGAYLAVDTQLNGNDQIDLFAQGDNAGIYMQDTLYKLNMNMVVPDGPASYAASPWDSLFGGKAFTAFKPMNITGAGFSYYDSAKSVVNSKQGDTLLKGYDSQYTARWNWHSLAPGGVDHYRQDIGLTKAPYVVPYTNKSYINETSKDGNNYVGDTVKFSLNVRNQGYNSSWGKLNLEDIIPAEFELDTNSIKLVNSDGTSVSVPSSAYNTLTHELSVDAGESIKDNQTVSVTFKAKILSSASGKTVRNTFYARGIDENNKDNPNSDISSSSFVDIPVEKETYLSSFAKLVKNETKEDKDYATSTTGTSGDIIDYQIKYSLDQDSVDTFSGGTLKDALPEGLVLDDTPITVTYSDGTSSKVTDLANISINSLEAGGSVTVSFKAKVTQKEAGTIKNIATLDGKTSTDKDISNSSEADLNVEKLSLKPTIIKQVGATWTATSDALADSIQALPGDNVLYDIKITPDANATDPLTAIQFRDMLPEGFVIGTNITAHRASTIAVNDPSSNIQILLQYDPAVLKNAGVGGGLDIDAMLDDAQNNPDSINYGAVPEGFTPTKDVSYEIKIPGIVDENLLEDIPEADSDKQTIVNTAEITSSSYGNEEAIESNEATINVGPLKSSVTKEVKEKDDTDDQYATHDSTPLEVNVGDELNYRVTIKPDSELNFAHLSNIKLQDNFSNGQLGKDVTLNGLTVHYFKKDGTEYTDKKESYTADQLSALDNYTLTLKSSLLATDYVQLVYDVKVNEDATEETVSNTAYITGSSYGPNNADQKREGWYSNESKINISAKGQIIVRYADRQTNKLITEATTDKTGQEVYDGKIGDDHLVQPKDLGSLGYTVVDSASEDNEIPAISDWKQPAKDYDLKFAKDKQVITYRYEKSRIGLTAPKIWNFGSYSLSKIDQTYRLKSSHKDTDGKRIPQSVNVTDYYTTKKWTLSVKQLYQFKGSIATHYPSGKVTSKTYELDDAALSLNNGNVTLTDNDDVAANIGQPSDVISDNTLDPSGNTSANLMTMNAASAKDGEYATHGFGTWHFNFGTKETMDQSINLHVPATTERHRTQYKTKLEWTLTVAE